jgi:hypothetical protein
MVLAVSCRKIPQNPYYMGCPCDCSGVCSLLVLFVAAYALCRFEIKVVVSGVLNAAAQQFKVPLLNRWWEVFEATGVTLKLSAKFLQPFLNRQRLNTLNLDLQINYFG